MKKTFTDRYVLVSGGTRGIGLASAIKFADEGARVAICSSSQQNVDKALPDIQKRSPESIGFKCDVSSPKEIDAMFGEIEQVFGRLDVCMVTAGVCPWTRIDEITSEELTRTYDINVRGLFLISQGAGRMMQRSGSGAIIHVGSISGFCADPEGGLASYCASKGAVHALTKCFAAEYGPLGIRANGIAPGWIASDMNADIRKDPEQMKTYTRLIPLGRFGETAEVAELAAFLASEEASFVNGAIVLIDGGNMSL